MTSGEILNWKEEAPVDESIEEYEYRRYPPQIGGEVMLNQAGQIRFTIESGDIFTHPHRSYLQIEGMITKADNTNFENIEYVTLANNGLMFLFNQARYEIGGREVETLLFPGQATAILGMLNYTEDFNTTAGLGQGWIKDKRTYTLNPPAGGNPATITPDALNSLKNPGFKRRNEYLIILNDQLADKGKFKINIPLTHIFGFCNDYDKIIYGVKHELLLTRKVDLEPVYSAFAIDPTDAASIANTTVKIHIKNMYWFVPIVKPAISYLNSLMSDMSKNINLKIEFDKRQVFSVAVPDAVRSYTWNLTTKAANEKPRFIVVAFQTGERTAQTANPSIFDHANVEELHVFLNNVKRYPALDFTLDFSNNDFMDSYNMAANFRSLNFGLPSCVSNFGVDPVDFKELYPLFVFDITKQSATLKTAITNITVEMKFKGGIPANTTAYAVVLSDNTLIFKSDGKEIRPDY